MAAAVPVPDSPLTRDALRVELQLLSRPSMPLAQPVLADGDTPEAFLADAEAAQRTTLAGAEAFGLSDALFMGSVATVFVGQKLACYCSVRNTSPVDINRVKVAVELELPLAKNQPPGAKKVVEQLGSRAISIDRIGPSETFGFIVNVSVKTEGRHSIVCRTQYHEAKHLGAKVTQPVFLDAKRALAVSFKENFLKENDLLLEATVSNVTGSALRIESVRLDAHAYLMCVDCNDDPCAFGGYVDVTESASLPGAPGSAAAGPAAAPSSATAMWTPPVQQSAQMGTSDQRQYLFRLRTAPGSSTALADVAYIGDLKIEWSAGFTDLSRKGGERSWRSVSAMGGSIKYEIQREHVAKPQIAVRVTAMPRAVRVEEPFAIALELSNTGSVESRLHLRVDRQRASAVMLADVAGTLVATVAPGATVTGVVVHFVALSTGVQPISGVTLADMAGEYAVPIPEVFVDN